MFYEILGNKPLITTIVAFLTSQTLKFFIAKYLGIEQEDPFFGTGGMPSSHSASTSALAISIGFESGWGTSTFALALGLAAIVIYDATHIRFAAGENAKRINILVEQLLHSNDSIETKLKTSLGHSVPQAIVGILLGIGISVASYNAL